MSTEAPVVRPCICGLDGSMIPLDLAIKSLLRDGLQGRVAIVGGPGSGKTTALRHLAATLSGKEGFAFLDEASPGPINDDFRGELVFYTASSERDKNAPRDLARFQLASWCEDQWIEFLLNRHRAECRSVMERVKRCTDFARIGRVPVLACIVLDEFARDERIQSPTDALRRFLFEHIKGQGALQATQNCCLNYLAGADAVKLARKLSLARKLAQGDVPPRVYQAVQHQPVQLVVAADRIMADLHRRRLPFYLTVQFESSLIETAGRAAAADPVVQRRLMGVVSKKRNGRFHAMAAGILVAMRTGWAPDGDEPPNLASAQLRGARWPRVRLGGANLYRANLTGAILSEAMLDGIKAESAEFCGANLSGASIRSARLRLADFSRADLSYVRGPDAGFVQAQLTGADMEGGLFEEGQFYKADLSEARAIRANFTGADLRGANMTDADFTSACFDEADLSDLDLRPVRLSGVRFGYAKLARCNLEDQRIPNADFQRANLEGSLLTGSDMPSADFRSACLVDTGLAEINWERADLRKADLTGASFHAGSSRSGLVGSPIACEGSRTGFYTDEYLEQGFMAPEEIRKANLRGADLRGALVMKTDFYLVDLRDAKYDAEQELHFRRCGAILETRVE